MPFNIFQYGVPNCRSATALRRELSPNSEDESPLTVKFIKMSCKYFTDGMVRRKIHTGLTSRNVQTGELLHLMYEVGLFFLIFFIIPHWRKFPCYSSTRDSKTRIKDVIENNGVQKKDKILHYIQMVNI